VSRLREGGMSGWKMEFSSVADELFEAYRSTYFNVLEPVHDRDQIVEAALSRNVSEAIFGKRS